MVHLILSSTKGNQGLRYFPYTGYLGLTPIRVEGIVRTRVDTDLRTLQATSLTVAIRCYESRLGRVNVLHSNLLVDHSQVLWSKADNVDFEPIANLEYPFRLTLPAKVGGFSTAMFIDYRCVWRIEAVLNHIHITGVGSRQVKHFQLPLVRYDLPATIPISPSLDPLLSHTTSKPRAPRIRYSIDSPTNPIGPNDLVSIPIHLQPMDPTVSIRSVNVIIERRIQFLDNPNGTPPPSPPTPIASVVPSPLPSQTEFPASSSSSLISDALIAPHLDSLRVNPENSDTSSLSSSNPTITPNSIFPSTASFANSSRPLLPSNILNPSLSAQTKLVINTLAEVESSGHFAPDVNGIWNRTMTLQWPAAKSKSRWAVGETMQSEIVSVRYFVRVKVTLQSPSGTDTLELSEKEIFAVSTNDAERRLAVTKYNEMLDMANQERQERRSKSKSPRRKPVYPEDLPPTPIPSSSLMTYPASNYKTRSTFRRPHTSAGPRDTSSTSDQRLETGSLGRRPRDDFGEAEPRGEVYTKRKSSRLDELIGGRTRPDSSQSEAKRGGRNYFFSSSAPKIGSTPSGSSTSTTTSSSSISSSSHGESESDDMREWEAELARIEIKSRRSSDLLGFAKFLRKRKPTTGVAAPRVVQPGS